MNLKYTAFTLAIALALNVHSESFSNLEALNKNTDSNLDPNLPFWQLPEHESPISDISGLINFTENQITTDDDANILVDDAQELGIEDDIFQVASLPIPDNRVEASPATLSLPNPEINIYKYINDFEIILVFNTATKGKVEYRQVGYIYKRDIDSNSKPFYKLLSIADVLNDGAVKSFMKARHMKSTNLENAREHYRKKLIKDNDISIDSTKPFFYITSGKQSYRNKTENGIARKSYQGTESGFFGIVSQEVEHKVDDNKDKKIDYTLDHWSRVNDKEGQGIHKYTTYKHKSGSHGCLRTFGDNARALYYLIASTKYGPTESESSNMRFLDSRNGTFEYYPIPDEIKKMSAGLAKTTKLREYEKSIITDWAEKDLADNGKRENLHRFKHRTNYDYRTMVIINSAPDRDYSTLGDKPVNAEPVKPNQG
jgi:hypothetical protein